ncbi:MAG: hypothetical protein GY927_00870 [bacterium]|nr:hypothetical protein [bacterium]
MQGTIELTRHFDDAFTLTPNPEKLPELRERAAYKGSDPKERARAKAAQIILNPNPPQTFDVDVTGLAEIKAHPDGGSTLVCERSNSLHLIPELRERSICGPAESPIEQAIAFALREQLRPPQTYFHETPALEEIRVFETPQQVQTALDRMQKKGAVCIPGMPK